MKRNEKKTANVVSAFDEFKSIEAERIALAEREAHAINKALAEREELKKRLAAIDAALTPIIQPSVETIKRVKSTSLRKRMTGRSKSDLKNFVSDAIASKQFDRKTIVKLAIDGFAADETSAKKIASTVKTYLSDAKNKKYCSFHALAVENKNGIFSFVE
ncbi:MAG: hypothetical protein SVK08_02950 [Halobacteriota archaeon]|nr:hypothetical protein [Halobacteriota archaeon]